MCIRQIAPGGPLGRYRSNQMVLAAVSTADLHRVKSETIWLFLLVSQPSTNSAIAARHSVELMIG
jgi:hypothetical protein